MNNNKKYFCYLASVWKNIKSGQKHVHLIWQLCQGRLRKKKKKKEKKKKKKKREEKISKINIIVAANWVLTPNAEKWQEAKNKIRLLVLVKIQNKLVEKQYELVEIHNKKQSKLITGKKIVVKNIKRMYF